MNDDDYDGPEGPAIPQPPAVGAGPGSVSFDLVIYDPKTGETQVFHCTGEVT